MSLPISRTPSDDEAVDLVRRRLLVAGGRYVAPAVLLTLLLSDNAYAQASCAPGQCSPGDPICPPTRNCFPFRGPG